MVGLFEPVCAPWNVDRIPSDFSFGEITPDWDRMGPYVERAMQRVPITLETGIRTFFCGPESFTPDLAPIVGEAPGIDNYFVAAGMNSVGILTGGGMGRIVAQWIVDGRPDVDVTGFNIDRMQDYQLNPRYRAERTVETLGMVYQTHFPGRSMQTARGVKRSPIHDRLVEQRAYFRDVSGWEGADWFAPEGVEPRVGRAVAGDGRTGSQYWADEHRAVREGVGLMDMSFMSKFQVQGPDAGRVLDRVSANAVDGEPGVITYTQWLNEGGTLEADLTVTKLDDDRFLVVASDNAHGHVQAWLRRHIGDDRAFATDVTSALAQINVQGPRSREVIQSLTSADMSNEAFPFRAARYIDIGFARALCVRITYLGELGYELYVPAEQAMHVYEQVVAAGAAYGLRHTGLKALASLRMEKGYRDYGHDIDNTDTVLEAGLGFAVALDKPGGFIGRDAVLAQKASRPAHPPARPGAAARSRAADAPRGGRLPRRRRGRLRARRQLRPHPRRRRRAGDARRRRAADRRLAGGRCVGGRRCRATDSGRHVAAADVRPGERPHPDVAAERVVRPVQAARDGPHYALAGGPAPGPLSVARRLSRPDFDGSRIASGSRSARSSDGEPHSASWRWIARRAVSILRATMRRVAHSVSRARRATSIASACSGVHVSPNACCDPSRRSMR